MVLPSTVRTSPSAGPGSSSATRSSVPSHGICGCSQVRKDSCVPSGLTLALFTKWLRSHSTTGSPPSSGTATSSVVAGSVSRTTSTWLSPSSTGSP